MADLDSRFHSVFRTVLRNPDLVLTPEMTAFDVDGWDSLAHIQLISALEKEYSVKFIAREVISLRNVGELADAVNRKVQARA